MQHKVKTGARTLSGLALALAVGAGLTACGDSTTDAGSSGSQAEVSTTEHNDADVTFATEMIQHHAQALSMVDLTLDRPLDPEVQALAEGIRDAQAPEIETMADWLTKWGETVPATMRDHVNSGHEMGDLSDTTGGVDGMDPGDEMPGMMTLADLDVLENASDEEFQDMWLQMMVEHHEGAIEMAEAEQADGQFKDAVDLAGQIIDAQKEEVVTMNDLFES
ncbi:DUF305 domain-containing protein [Nocardioides sp. STR2]|uniref:DUF305 domain-containing protein n=1 Tax=Nocardioides pini TaxID=2975053 RepID=A0ABT4CHX0_9ACTN|nr:DUF305 domain-containing protein [Nocardioides pini]MCY4728553.1 DUF305 domain-containing protein [Nocardioides pini]